MCERACGVGRQLIGVCFLLPPYESQGTELRSPDLAAAVVYPLSHLPDTARKIKLRCQARVGNSGKQFLWVSPSWS